MSKVLGLDLGVGSIGWSLIEVDNDRKPQNIIALGSRIVPLSTDDATEFSSGKAISKNQKRTQKRTARKGYDRYQLRRQNLTEELRKLQMLPDESLIKLPVLELWQLRADAASKGTQLSLKQIGRILYHINQKRGYKHSKADSSSEDKEQKDYVAQVNARYKMIRELDLTIGQYFAQELKKSETITEKGKFYTYRTKDQVFPRIAYEAEFDRIMSVQKEFYPTILTDDVIKRLRNEIIFYQRGLKSCKHLVSICEFEKKAYVNKEGKVVYDGPKVAPVTSPLFQVCKIWEAVNNITLKKQHNTFNITPEHRQAMFEFLDSHEKMTIKDMYKLLGISQKDGWWGGKAIGKGLQGNITKYQLKKALGDKHNDLLQFNLSNQDSSAINTNTGEILQVQVVNPDFEKEPLYRLWHTIYSISHKEELEKVLRNKFNITDNEVIDKLFAIDFGKQGFGNKSAKAMRRILPYLQEGFKYSEACEKAGFRHSESLSTEENEARELLEHIPLLKKNELRQPVVEKILNQMINLVNALIDEYGPIDSIRVELARELKQSKEERESTYKNINKNEKVNKEYAEKIEEFGIRVSRSRIQKYRMWMESDQKCFYCGQPVNASEFLSGFDVEIEHVIPKSLFFDDSFSNKVCACRKCNAEKNNKTAYDYMASKGEAVLNDYIARVEQSFKDKKISKTKHDRLLTSQADIPTDFIDRDLRLSQYISRKAIEILKQVCRHVNASSGGVTDFIRHIWGYDEILHQLNFNRYQSVGLTEVIEYSHKNETHTQERIKGWTKRLDHRHHAIDALVVALTQQGYIQRLNNLNTERDQMFTEIEKQSQEWRDEYSLLQEWMRERPHFPTAAVADAIDKVLVSFKAGKRVATKGKRIKYEKGKKIVLQDNIIIPRGALSEESVYGIIQTIEKNKPVKYIFENPDLIVKPYIKRLVEERLQEYEGDVKKALASLKKKPILVSKNRDQELQYASCFKSEYVIKEKLSDIKEKDINSIIDEHIKNVVRERLSAHNNNVKEAFCTPLYADKDQRIPIRSIRRIRSLSGMKSLKSTEDGQVCGFVKPGNNHHVAIYKDSNGNLQEQVLTFWDAVERKKYGIPIIITNPKQVWDCISDLTLPDMLLNNLPDISWQFVTSLQQNEMFLLGMEDDVFNDAIRNNDYATLNKYLYRVQKIGSMYYVFRHHIETQLDDSTEAKDMLKFHSVRSLGSFTKLQPKKVRISMLGKIIIE